MTKFEIYSLILCIIVFVMLVGLFSYMLAIIVKYNVKHVKAGLEDESIIKEFNKEKTQRRSKLSKVGDILLNILLCAFFGSIFFTSLYVNCTQNLYFDKLPTFRVVLTSSMEEKNENNKYLFDNKLDNQFGAFDLIATYKVPAEEDLKLYDIVVYEVDGVLVVHRIVGIEEPNKYHPNERHFQLQGDAVGSPDRFPVRYSQIKGIYKDQKVPFVGSFILFTQSPAGWLCILLVIASFVVTPILEKKLSTHRNARLEELRAQGLLGTGEEENEEETTEENADIGSD